MKLELWSRDGRQVEIPEPLFRLYLGLIRDGLTGAWVNDLARTDAHVRITDWFWDTYSTVVNPADFEVALGKAINKVLARELKWTGPPARPGLRTRGRKNNDPR